jgi:hypothetical protein
MAVHAWRTRQNTYWIWIIIFFQPVGPLVYLFAILLPEWMGGSTARRFGQAARDTLDPGRAYRTARAAYDEAPTVQNMMKLAEAASDMSGWQEAEDLYRKASQGLYADDPALLQGRARALLELGRPAESLELIEQLEKQGTVPPQGDLIRARDLFALGRAGEAERYFKSAAERLPGLEAMARYGVFLYEVGRRDEAKEILTEITRRAAKTQAHFRREAMAWRDFAAKRIAA